MKRAIKLSEIADVIKEKYKFGNGSDITISIERSFIPDNLVNTICFEVYVKPSNGSSFHCYIGVRYIINHVLKSNEIVIGIEDLEIFVADELLKNTPIF